MTKMLNVTRNTHFNGTLRFLVIGLPNYFSGLSNTRINIRGSWIVGIFPVERIHKSET